jgi:hypothetical protein
MIKQKNKQISLSGREKAVLIIASIIIVSTLPLTYIFFLLPLLNLPIAILAILVLLGVIKNHIAVRIIQVLAIIGAIVASWLTIVLLDWQSQP